jgi:hypothetical protein
VVDRLVRPRLPGMPPDRDEAWQAHQLTKTLGILGGAGVDGVFVFTFAAQSLRRQAPVRPRQGQPRPSLGPAGGHGRARARQDFPPGQLS